MLLFCIKQIYLVYTNKYFIQNLMISLALIQDDRSQKKKHFHENQQGMNSRIRMDHSSMNNRPQIQPIIGLSSRNLSPKKVQFQMQGQKVQTKNQIYSKVLKEQINLHQFQNSADTYRNRKRDEQNAKLYKKNYPFGKENVNIKSGVLQKYMQNNYLSQSRMLKQFEQLAKKSRYTNTNDLKQSRLVQSRHDIMRLRDTRKKVSKLLPTQKSQIQQIRGLYNKKIEQAKEAALHEKNQIRNLQNMLKQLKTDMQRSKSTRAKNIFDLRNHLERPQNYGLKYFDSLDRCQQIIRHKIPVVIYNNQTHDARSYFGNGDGSTLHSIDRGIRHPQKSKQFNQILHVLRKNQQRMGILAHSQPNNPLSFNRSCVYP